MTRALHAHAAPLSEAEPCVAAASNKLQLQTTAIRHSRPFHAAICQESAGKSVGSSQSSLTPVFLSSLRAFQQTDIKPLL